MNVENFILDARTVVTVLSFLTFIGIVLWTYSGRRGADFAAAAGLPFADDMDKQEADEHHG